MSLVLSLLPLLMTTVCLILSPSLPQSIASTATMSAEDVANAFVNHFYSTLDTNPSALAALYQPQSVLTFEGQKCEGAQNILEKYMVSSLPSSFLSFPLAAFEVG